MNSIEKRLRRLEAKVNPPDILKDMPPIFFEITAKWPRPLEQKKEDKE